MKSAEETLKTARNVLEIEAQTISRLKDFLNDDFYQSVKLIYEGTGRVVVTGIGKSAIIANKIVATFNSTGTPSLFMHAADAVHGDLGMIKQEDVIICLSNSGNTPEIKLLVPWLKEGGNKLIAMVGNQTSFLAQNADFVLNTSITAEACPNNLAPTSSTTAQLAMGDALAVCLLEWKKFSKDDFARYHPGGALGKKLYLRVNDIFIRNEKPVVNINADLKTVIMEISSKRLGATAVTDENGNVAGVITDGDLRRLLSRNEKLEGLKASDIMSKNPKTISKDELAVKALELMRENKITQIIVAEGKKYLGIVHIHDLNLEGIIV